MSISNDQPQIAIICDTVPYPSRSGDNQRVAELIHVARERGWRVHLVLCGFVDRSLKRLCQSHVDVLHVYSGSGLKTRIRNTVRCAVRFADRAGAIVGIRPMEEIAKQILGRPIAPLVIDYWQRYPAGLDNYVSRLSQNYQWKAVIVEYIWLHRATDKIHNGVVRLLDTHDLQHKRIEEFASRGMTFPLPISREEESQIFNKFDAVIAIQNAEAAAIREMCPHLKVVTAGSSGSAKTSTLRRPVEGRVLYIGGYNGANVDGLRRFLDSAWQDVHRQIPSATLHICGFVYRGFPDNGLTNVVFLGHKENIESEYEDAAVVINPVWIGTGLKIKTVEALARAKPLVTTAKGIEGLPPGVSDCVVVAENEKEFAADLVRLLADTEERHRLSQLAAAFASNHLSKNVVYRELFEFLAEQR